MCKGAPRNQCETDEQFACGCSFREAPKLLPVRARDVTATEIKPEEARAAAVIGGRGRECLYNQRIAGIYKQECRVF